MLQQDAVCAERQSSVCSWIFTKIWSSIRVFDRCILTPCSRMPQIQDCSDRLLRRYPLPIRTFTFARICHSVTQSLTMAQFGMRQQHWRQHISGIFSRVSPPVRAHIYDSPMGFCARYNLDINLHYIFVAIYQLIERHISQSSWNIVAQQKHLFRSVWMNGCG